MILFVLVYQSQTVHINSLEIFYNSILWCLNNMQHSWQYCWQSQKDRSNNNLRTNWKLISVKKVCCIERQFFFFFLPIKVEYSTWSSFQLQSFWNTGTFFSPQKKRWEKRKFKTRSLFENHFIWKIQKKISSCLPLFSVLERSNSVKWVDVIFQEELICSSGPQQNLHRLPSSAI